MALVSGWGRTGYGGPQSQALLTAALPLVDHATCARVFARNRQAVSRNVHVCAGGTGVDACQGDSGSALFAPRMRNDRSDWDAEEETRFELVGVTSFGARCGQVGVPGGFARASFLLRWIFGMMRRDEHDYYDDDDDETVVTVCKGFFGKWYDRLND